MTPSISRRAAPAVFIASLAFAAPALADVRSVETTDGVQLTLSGADLTVVATAKASPPARRTLQQPGLRAFCISGIPPEDRDDMPGGGFEYVVVGNVLTLTDGVQRTTFKRDISATVDLCGIEDPDGADIALAPFSERGQRMIESDDEAQFADPKAHRRLTKALDAAEAERAARGGRFPSARRLQRAIVRRTNGTIRVRLARRQSGIRRPRTVYIVGTPRARTLTLATRTRYGSVVGIQVTRRGVSHFEQIAAE